MGLASGADGLAERRDSLGGGLVPALPRQEPAALSEDFVLVLVDPLAQPADLCGFTGCSPVRFGDAANMLGWYACSDDSSRSYGVTREPGSC